MTHIMVNNVCDEEKRRNENWNYTSHKIQKIWQTIIADELSFMNVGDDKDDSMGNLLRFYSRLASQAVA